MTKNKTSETKSTIRTVDELAAWLRVDRKTLYAAIQRGEVPGVLRLGRVVRIHQPTIMAWIQS